LDEANPDENSFYRHFRVTNFVDRPLPHKNSRITFRSIETKGTPMSLHQTPSSMTSRQAAIANLPADADTQRQIFDDLFKARDEQREEVRKIREASKVRDREAMMQERLGIDPVTIRSMKMWEGAFARNDYRASIAFTQFMIFANARGWGADREKPADEDDRSVMDQTRTARRMVGLGREYRGSRPTFGMTIQSKQEMETVAAAERIYAKLRAGVPDERLREGEGAGRPSNAWQEAYRRARARIEDEDSAAEMIANAEAELGPEENAA
jgi:hypothetical protein